MTNPSFTSRISEATELLSVDAESLTKDLQKAGIDNDSTGISLLNAETTTNGDLVGVLEAGCGHGKPNLKLKAAAAILKGESLTKTTTPRENKMPVINAGDQQQSQSLAEVIKANRPIDQWSDRDLLERYSKDREDSVEQELNKRAKQQNFVVLKPGKFDPGKEEIDIDMTLDLLKSARKRTNPSMVPVTGGVLPVYKIGELNPQDRIVEMCPICGESLYRGYCEKCLSNFAGVGDDERAYVKLITESDNFNPESFSDRKAVATSARMGLDDLRVTWPSIEDNT